MIWRFIHLRWMWMLVDELQGKAAAICSPVSVFASSLVRSESFGEWFWKHSILCPAYFLSRRQWCWSSRMWFYRCSHWEGRGRTHSLESKSQRCSDISRKVLVAWVAMQCVTKPKHRKRFSAPENRLLTLFWEEGENVYLLDWKERSKDFKGVCLLLFFFLVHFSVFHSNDLMGRGTYLGEFLPPYPPIKSFLFLSALIRWHRASFVSAFHLQIQEVFRWGLWAAFLSCLHRHPQSLTAKSRGTKWVQWWWEPSLYDVWALVGTWAMRAVDDKHVGFQAPMALFYIWYIIRLSCCHMIYTQTMCQVRHGVLEVFEKWWFRW